MSWNAVEAQTLHYRTNACNRKQTHFTPQRTNFLKQGLDVLRSHSLCRLNHAQGKGAVHRTTTRVPVRDCWTGASLSPQLPADQADSSKAGLAPTEQHQMMLINEHRTLGRPGCSFGSEAMQCL